MQKATAGQLIALRDRIGLLTDNERHEALQRLTWIWGTPEGVAMMNQAIDDVTGGTTTPCS